MCRELKTFPSTHFDLDTCTVVAFLRLAILPGGSWPSIPTEENCAISWELNQKVR